MKVKTIITVDPDVYLDGLIGIFGEYEESPVNEQLGIDSLSYIFSVYNPAYFLGYVETLFQNASVFVDDVKFNNWRASFSDDYKRGVEDAKRFNHSTNGRPS